MTVFKIEIKPRGCSDKSNVFSLGTLCSFRDLLKTELPKSLARVTVSLMPGCRHWGLKGWLPSVWSVPVSNCPQSIKPP